MSVWHRRKQLDMTSKSAHQNEEVIKVWLSFNPDHGLSSICQRIRGELLSRKVYVNRDVDSDGDEIPALEPEDPTDYQYSLWFTVDINVLPPDPQATVDLTAPCLVLPISKITCRVKVDSRVQIHWLFH